MDSSVSSKNAGRITHRSEHSRLTISLDTMLTELVSPPLFKVYNKQMVVIWVHSMNILPMPRISRRFLVCSDSKLIKDLFKKKDLLPKNYWEYTLVQKIYKKCSLNQYAVVVPRRASVKVSTAVGGL
jgi:hypothetical protein